jgi:hypothetical protein
MAGSLTLSTLKDDTGVLAVQNGMSGIAKAWVRFAGSNGSVFGAFNVSSVTRNGTGSYTINFTTAMPDTNYSVVATPKRITGNNNNGILASVTYNGTLATTSVPISCCQTGSSNEDPDFASVSVFR